MMHSMNTTGMHAASAAFGSIHALAMLAGLAGFVLLLAWAIKSMPAAQLKQWGLWLFVGGIIASLLTFGAMAVSYGDSCPMMKDGKCAIMEGDMMMQGGMHDMHDMGSMDDEDHMGMSMDDMSAMLEGKTGDAFDEAFLRMMIPHHQGAIDMVKDVESSAKHEELKQLAREIAVAQQREIDMMNGWLQAWGYND